MLLPVAVAVAYPAAPALADVQTQPSLAKSQIYADEDKAPPESGAPDISAVIVSRTGGGLVTFRVSFAKPVEITSDMGFDIWIDADRSRATGDEDGLDYVLDFSFDGPTQRRYASVYAYVGDKDYESIPPSLEFSKSRNGVVFTIAAEDLGSSLHARLAAKHPNLPRLAELGEKFDFYAGAGRNWNDSEAPVDWTPTWTFPEPDLSVTGGKPNLSEITVSRTASGALTFTIAFAAPAYLGPDTKLQVMLDTDRDSGNGIQGSEYALDYSAGDGDLPFASLLTVRGGESESSVPSSLHFSHTARSATFEIAAADIGNPSSFDFWVFVEEDGEFLDNAPTHVLVSPESAPWTYPKDGAPQDGRSYPVETYTDTSDTSLVDPGSFPWLVAVLLGLLGLGAVLGIAGYTYEKLRKRRPPGPTPLPAR